MITGENIRLPPKATLALGIAFHELATNAVKYGAFSNETGSILIDVDDRADAGGRPADAVAGGRRTALPSRRRPGKGSARA